MSAPRYEAGWIVGAGPDGSRRYEAFLRPYSEDWYDLFSAATWWEALAKGMALARDNEDCAFDGRIGEALYEPR